MKWNGGEEVDEEPCLDVSLCDLGSAHDKQPLVLKGTEECEDDVQKEARVNQKVEDKLSCRCFVDEADSIWYNQGSVQQEKHNPHVPCLF